MELRFARCFVEFDQHNVSVLHHIRPSLGFGHTPCPSLDCPSKLQKILCRPSNISSMKHDGLGKKPTHKRLDYFGCNEPMLHIGMNFASGFGHHST